MLKRTTQRNAVFVMALYNIVVGALFFFLHKEIFGLFGIAGYAPVHAPTIQVPCLLLVVFGLGYLCAYHDMVRNRDMLFLGMLQNATVAGIVAWYKFTGSPIVHDMYLLPAGISALFAIAFLVAWLGSLVEAGRQRRQRRLVPIEPAAKRGARAPARGERVVPAPAEAGASEEKLPPEAPEEEVLPEAPEEMPEPRPPDAPAQPGGPEEEPHLRFLAERDRSGIPGYEPPPAEEPA